MIETGTDYCGAGAFEEAIKRLNLKQKIIFACDMDKFARRTFVSNHGTKEDLKKAGPELKNIMQENFSFYFPDNVYNRSIPEKSLDVYMTSPPCQSFSYVGRREGEKSEKGVLFYNSHEFIKKNNPRYFVFENVKGLLSDDKKNKKRKHGRTFQKWIDYLGGKSINGNPVLFPHEKSVPYHIYYFVLNARGHNIPQNRERVFIVGIRDDKDNFFSVPKVEELKIKMSNYLEEKVDEKYFLSKKKLDYMKREKKDFKGRFNPLDGSEDYAYCITTRAGERVTDNFLIVKTKRSEEQKKKRGLEKEKFSERVFSFEKQDYSDTILENPNHNKEGLIYQDDRIRKLTPRECFRLQDFDDNFKIVVSDAQAYKQAGNSIPVGLLVKIIKQFNFG